MSYALRFYAVLPSGELKQIGAQTLRKIVEGTQACVLEVGSELKVIQAMCAKEGRTLKSIEHVTKRIPATQATGPATAGALMLCYAEG